MQRTLAVSAAVLIIVLCSLDSAHAGRQVLQAGPAASIVGLTKYVNGGTTFCSGQLRVVAADGTPVAKAQLAFRFSHTEVPATSVSNKLGRSNVMTAMPRGATSCTLELLSADAAGYVFSTAGATKTIAL